MGFRIAALAGALALASLSAPVAAQTFNAEQVKTAVTQDDLVVIVGSLGHQVMEQGTGSEIFVLAEDPAGTSYFLIGAGCDVDDVPGCRGVIIRSQFELPPGTSTETLAKANLEIGALNTSADFEGMALVFTRFQLIDFGVTMGNIRENVAVMLGLIAEAYPIAAGEQ